VSGSVSLVQPSSAGGQAVVLPDVERYYEPEAQLGGIEVRAAEGARRILRFINYWACFLDVLE